MWNPFRRKPKEPKRPEETVFEEIWNERLQKLESLYGKSDDTVGHGIVPFLLGPEAGGAADIVYFSDHIPGRLSVTAELIGCDEQKRSRLGNYELAIAHRSKEERWGPNLICRLAHYTLQEVLQPGETMDMGPSVPKGSTIDAFLFCDYGRFELRGEPSGVLLCVGITAKEKRACLSGKGERVFAALKEKGVYPYTDMSRDSVI